MIKFHQGEEGQLRTKKLETVVERRLTKNVSQGRV